MKKNKYIDETQGKQMNEIFISNSDDCKHAIERCEQDLEKYESSIVVEEWREYYNVARITYKNKRAIRHPLFVLQCDDENIVEHAEYLIRNNMFFACGKLGDELLRKTLNLMDKQKAAKANTLKSQITQTKNQNFVHESR